LHWPKRFATTRAHFILFKFPREFQYPRFNYEVRSPAVVVVAAAVVDVVVAAAAAAAHVVGSGEPSFRAPPGVSRFYETVPAEIYGSVDQIKASNCHLQWHSSAFQIRDCNLEYPL
jgi:hypothetical protein